MKLFFILSFGVVTSYALDSALAQKPGISDLLKHGQKMIEWIEEAQSCRVTQSGNGDLNLCTGITLNKKDQNFLKGLTLKSCREFLSQMKFKTKVVNFNNKLKEVPKADWDDFFSSTKLALILYQERIILFKREAKRGDCLHEIIHFYQRHRRAESPLSPLKRKQAQRRLQFLLEEGVKRVEKLERAKKIQRAQQEAAQLRPFIALQKEWQGMLHWLDEKEVYQLFFDYPHLMGTGERDYDVALSNLVRLKESLAWSLRERVLRAANRELNKKYLEVSIPQKITQTEEELERLFRQGRIARSTFERKVIGIRKFKANQKLIQKRREKDLLGILQSRIAMRAFDREEKQRKSEALKGFSLKREQGLWYLELEGKKMIVDTGAHVSVLPPQLIDKFTEESILLLGVKKLQNTYGQVVQAPLVALKDPLTLGGRGGGQKIVGLRGAVGNLNLGDFDGVLGMDFLRRFNDGQWVFNMNKDTLKKGTLTGKKSYSLSPNGWGQIDALEFRCGKRKVRVDSGSQYFGELKRRGSRPECLKASQQQKLTRLKKGNTILFSRDVEVNLGLPFLREYKKIAVDLKNERISFD